MTTIQPTHGNENMTNNMLQNKLTSDRVTLQRRYNTLSGGIKNEGVDVKAIKEKLRDISEQMTEIDRQMEFVS